MKRHLQQIGKLLATVLYWGATVGIGYTAYYDYLSEHNWTSLCFMVSFISAGIAAHGLFLQWIYKVEIEHFAVQHKKSYPKIEKAVSVASFVFLGLFMISFIIGMLGPLAIKIGIGMLIVIRSTWVHWISVFSCLAASLLLRIPRNSVFLNTSAKILYRIFLVSFIALIVYIEILILKNLPSSGPMREDALFAAGTILLFILAGVSYMLYKSSKKGIFSFAAMKYVLFLRAFKDDNISRFTYRLLKNSCNIPIKLIGNPAERDTWYNNEDSDEDPDTEMEKDMHWLPSRNWKFFLRFYISRAKAIVMVAGSSDGLIWEVLQNVKRLNKCIIHYTSVIELENFKTKLQEMNNPDLQLLIYTINKILTQNCNYDAFVIQNDKVYLGKVTQLTKLVLKGDYKAASRIIDLSSNYKDATQSWWKCISYKVFRHLHILNFINTLESVQNGFIRTTLSTIAAIIGITYYFGTIVLGAGLILYPLVIWTVPDIDFVPLGAKILGFFIGCYILKGVFSKDN